MSDRERLRGETPQWEYVRDGKADAAFVTSAGDIFARARDSRSSMWSSCRWSGSPRYPRVLTFVEKHPDIVDKFLKGICEGIAYFKTHRAESIKIIKDKYKDEGELDDETATHLYDELKMILQAKPYATIPAISNVYEISIEQDKTAEKTDPDGVVGFSLSSGASMTAGLSIICTEPKRRSRV